MSLAIYSPEMTKIAIVTRSGGSSNRDSGEFVKIWDAH